MMKRALLIACLFLLISESSANSVPFFPPLQPIDRSAAVQDCNNNITSAPDPFVTPSSFNLSALSRIEQSLFGRSFVSQNVSSRLSRIEKTLFNTTYPNSSAAQRIDNVISNFNQLNKYPNISKNTLSKIENKVFSQTFPQNSPDRRIERLEQQMFGAVQSGDITSRYQNLITASKKFNPDTVINSYYPMPAGGPKLRNVLGNLGNTMLGGSMTGFTPPIDPYGYGPNGNYSCNNPLAGLNSGGGIYRGSRVNNGLNGYSYNDSFSDFGTGTGVHILD